MNTINKTILKEIVNNIVANKLKEAKGKPVKYGYVLSGKGTDDPVLQLVGHGNSRASHWKKVIEREVVTLLNKVKQGDWRSVSYMIKDGSVLSDAVGMMDEIYTAADLKEDLSTNSAAAANPSIETNDAVSRAQGDMAKYRKKLDDTSVTIKDLESKITRREEPVKKANARDQLQIDRLKKQQGPIIDKMNGIQRKIDSKSQ